MVLVKKERASDNDNYVKAVWTKNRLLLLHSYLGKLTKNNWHIFIITPKPTLINLTTK